MHALLYLWDLGDRFDPEALRRRAVERGPAFEGLPGLLSKAFLLDEAGRRFGGSYIWGTREDADRFLASDLFASSKAAMGEPQIQRFEIPALVGPAAETVVLPPKRLTFNHAMIYGRDVDRSAGFYRDRLGFRLIERMDGYARLEAPGGRGTIAIHLAEADRELPRSEGIRLYFEIEEIDRFCDRLAADGVVLLQLPKEMPWGWRHAYLKDPDGHEISIYRAGEARFKATAP